MATAEVYCISIVHSVDLGSSYPVPVIFDRDLYTYPDTLSKLTDNKSNIDNPTHLLINN
jgi:hypothetical protein